MPKFRKKPVVIEAVQVPPLSEPFLEVPDWLLDAVEGGNVWVNVDGQHIATLEGVMLARPGDWIVQGIKGEIYPVKPDIFADTYEPADTPPSGISPDFIREQARIAAAEAWKTGRPVMYEQEREHPEWFKGRFDQWADYQARLRGERHAAAMRRVFREAFYCEVVTLALAHEAATEAVK